MHLSRWGVQIVGNINDDIEQWLNLLRLWPSFLEAQYREAGLPPEEFVGSRAITALHFLANHPCPLSEEQGEALTPKARKRLLAAEMSVIG